MKIKVSISREYDTIDGDHADLFEAVSYTHLTLPTTSRV